MSECACKGTGRGLAAVERPIAMPVGVQTNSHAARQAKLARRAEFV
jgi:hypothetical protein